MLEINFKYTFGRLLKYIYKSATLTKHLYSMRNYNSIIHFYFLISNITKCLHDLDKTKTNFLALTAQTHLSTYLILSGLTHIL